MKEASLMNELGIHENSIAHLKFTALGYQCVSNLIIGK